jgi:geranylgeranyl transferase type-2 subunit beta
MVPEDIELHIKFILHLEEDSSKSDVFYFTDHKRLSGVYWALSSLALLNRLEALPRERIIDYVLSCYHPSISLETDGNTLATKPRRNRVAQQVNNNAQYAAFSGNSDQDPHLLYTLSGVQVLALYDALDRINCEAIVAYVVSMQRKDGSFAGDEWGEVDSRFSYCALLTLAILGRMDAVNLEAAVSYVVSCVNFDGGFGCIPGAESHAGQVFCCVGALKLCNALNRIDDELLGWWLCERQLPCGGFNGRPDKKEDVCYSWWVLSSLAMLSKMDWIDARKLTGFIRECQDPEGGGIADRPDDMADVFHTFFGLAGLSLMGDELLAAIDPMYALPAEIVLKLQQRYEGPQGYIGAVTGAG